MKQEMAEDTTVQDNSIRMTKANHMQGRTMYCNIFRKSEKHRVPSINLWMILKEVNGTTLQSGRSEWTWWEKPFQ